MEYKGTELEYKGIRIEKSDSVYEPNEDSFLLAEAARRFAFGEVLDLGCGTGIAGISAAKNPKTRKILFADVSEKALSLAAHNVHQNRVDRPIAFIKTDLFTRVQWKYDTLCFNPPYLPTVQEEKLKGKLNKAFDGGKDGRKVVDRFLETFAHHLKPRGILLLLNSSLSSKDGLSGNRITQEKLEKQGFSVKMVFSERFFFEKLVVFKAHL